MQTSSVVLVLFFISAIRGKFVDTFSLILSCEIKKAWFSPAKTRCRKNWLIRARQKRKDRLLLMFIFN